MSQEQQPQRQDSTIDQLRDVMAMANKMGCYDAADVINRIISGKRISRPMTEDEILSILPKGEAGPFNNYPVAVKYNGQEGTWFMRDIAKSIAEAQLRA